MGGAPVLIPPKAAILARLGLALLAALGAVAPPASGAESPFPVRAIKFPGPPADPAVRADVEFALALGFNAVWIDAPHALRWFDEPPSEISPAFLEVVGGLRARGVRVLLSVNPPSDSRGRFAYSGRDGEKKILRLFERARRSLGVHDFVLSFDDQPTELREIRDALTYGRSAAPAHLDLARRVRAKLRRGDRLWLCAAAYADSHLGDGSGPYAAAFLGGLSRLQSDVGIVWTGPEVVPPAISAEAIRKTTERLGGREILLYDNYGPGEAEPDALSAYLGPLRGRDAGLAPEVAVYLACPSSGTGVSRLSLATVAGWLSSPRDYDADGAWRREIERLAGGNPSALEALSTQTLEWRGWERGRPFRPWDPASPAAAAAALDDPAIVSSWDWTVRRYPDRIAALAGLADPAFRDALVEIMERRLAIARAVPIAVEYRARTRAGRTDLEALADALRAERVRASTRGTALRALDAFLAAAGIPAPPL